MNYLQLVLVAAICFSPKKHQGIGLSEIISDAV